MLPNRVRRNYLGGAVIDRLQAETAGRVFDDGDKPEEWVASLVSARNPGLPHVENEGLSRCAINGQPLLKDLLQAAPDFYLGKKRQGGVSALGFLLKILDSSMRLHVQAHPTAEFARQYMNSPYGKFECYYVLSVREGTEGYLRLGFQYPPSKKEWRRIIEEQDIPAMDACFENIPVKAGDVWYIPGGMPHAIGENILMLEIMEPSDLVVRCEFEREGIVVPPQARYMGRDLDFCLDIFDYTQQPASYVMEKYKLCPKPIDKSEGVLFEELIAPPVAPFCVRKITLEADAKGIFETGGFCNVATVTRGKVVVKTGGETAALRQGQSLFIAAAAESLEIYSEEPSELCFVNKGLEAENV